MSRMRFQDKIRNLCEERELSQTALARRVGVKPGTLSKWINGDRKVKLLDALAIARALDVDLDYLADDSLDRPRHPVRLSKDQEALLRLADEHGFVAITEVIGRIGKKAAVAGVGDDAARVVPPVGILSPTSHAQADGLAHPARRTR